MKVLELFSGTQSISKKFREAGHECLCVELNPIFLHEDYGKLSQLTMSVADLTVEMVLEKLGGYPDIIWASPVCKTHSVAAFGCGHREKKEDGLMYPVSADAYEHDKAHLAALRLIEELKPALYYIENPRGGMRKSYLMQEYNAAGRYTITYCQYGDERMKPTDIWTNHPDPCFKPPCKNGSPCHVAAPRGAKTGTQGLKNNMLRSVIPPEFCEYVVEISERYVEDRRLNIKVVNDQAKIV